MKDMPVIEDKHKGLNQERANADATYEAEDMKVR
jgi:hypothetical protein